MAPLPRHRVSAADRRAFAMFNASPHCIWEPMKRLGVAAEWYGASACSVSRVFCVSEGLGFSRSRALRRLVEASVEGAFTSGVAAARLALSPAARS